MTRDETIMLMVRVKGIWPGFARQQSREEKAGMIAVWSEKLLGVTPDEGLQAIDVLRLDEARLPNVPPNLVDIIRAVVAVRTRRLPGFDRMFDRLLGRVRELQDEESLKTYIRRFAPLEVQEFVNVVGWDVLWGYPENGTDPEVLRGTWARIVRQSVHRGVGMTQEIESAGNTGAVGAGSPRQLGVGAGSEGEG